MVTADPTLLLRTAFSGNAFRGAASESSKMLYAD
jgi:hypothetical protein